jgi:hypothetical protein
VKLLLWQDLIVDTCSGLSHAIRDDGVDTSIISFSMLGVPLSNRQMPTRVLPLSSFAAAHPHRLSVLLKLGNECVTLLDHICILLVLVVRPVGLDDSIDPVDRARYPVSGDKLGKIPKRE